jgi:cytidine deaminase
MKENKIEIPVKVYAYEELSEANRQLIDKAKEMTYHSYAPYSHFSVGAAALLANGEIVCGSNQENAAYPSGICAERTTLFYANSQYPDVAVVALAITARSESKTIDEPVAPCGSCRQVMVETEQRSKQPLRVLCQGEIGPIMFFEGIESLMPFIFLEKFL